MRYIKICRLYDSLESTTKRLKKIELLSDFFSKTPASLLKSSALLAQGRVFPSWSEREIGVASKLMLKAIYKSTGMQEKEIAEKVKSTGDYGLSAEYCVQRKRQQTLASRQPLELKEVHEKLERLADIRGKGSVELKLAGISELMGRAQPLEARYLVRTILEEMRIGVASGTIRNAIASAFDIPVSSVEHAHELLNDWGEIALIAKQQGEKGLLKLKLEPGRPIKVMLAQKAASVPDAIDSLGKCAFEYKYDGMRMQIHKNKGIQVFTRRLDELTNQFPDIVRSISSQVKGDSFIIEGEAVAVDPKTGALLPFQALSRRIKRKYDVEKIGKEIPCVLYLFDLLFLNGKSYLKEPFEKRRKTLTSIVTESNQLMLANQLVTRGVNKAEAFFEEALKKGQEGLMAKNLSSPYKPGSRMGHMLKIKTTMENLDLVIVGAEWGEGRRTKWLASLLLACKDEEGYLSIGKLGTGLTDEQFKEMTKALEPLILAEKGKQVKIKPKIVIEVAYEEIQKSPTYSSGYALRFPRLVQVREDKGPEDASDIDFITKLYDMQ